MARLINNVNKWINEALREDYNTTHEKVTWDAAITVLPDFDPEDPTQEIFRPLLALFFEIPGEGDQKVVISPILSPIGLTKEFLIGAVNSALEALRAKRDALADMEEEGYDYYQAEHPRT